MKASREQLEHQANSQHALYVATLGQIRVASIQASMEAIKMDSERVIASFRQVHVDQLRAAAAQINDVVSDVESAIIVDSVTAERDARRD
jgi:hypothetical protein